MNLESCINNEYIGASITEKEMTVIIPLIRDLMNCETLDDILFIIDYTPEELLDIFKISAETIECWSKNGISEYEKYSLTFIICSQHLESLRYHTCQACGADFFSKSPVPDVCEKCAAKIYQYWIC